MRINKLNFTKECLDKLPLLEKQYDVSDAKLEGLSLRVSPGGSKTFNLLKKINGRQVRYKLGRFPEMTIHNARLKAGEAILRFNAGENLSAIKAEGRKELTFGDLWERYYVEHLMKNSKRPDDNRKMIEKYVIGRIGKHKLSSISKADIKSIHLAITDNKVRKPSETINYAHADRIITIVSSVFNFGIREEYYVGSNPCMGVKKFQHISRDRFLSKDELQLFTDAVAVESEIFRDFFLVLLYTGARKTNVLEMKWSEIDFELNRWRIAETQTKNKDVNIVVLSQHALEILRRRKEQNVKMIKPSQFVFPGDSKDGNLKDPKRAFQRIRDRMGVQDIRMHDLRRTLGSYMAISGVSLPIIGKALNHKSQVSTAIYARLSQNPVEDAVNIAANLMLTFGSAHIPSQGEK